MAGIITSIMGSGGLGGSSAKTDRGNFLKGIGDLSNVFNWALPFGKQQGQTGTATTATGTRDIGDATSYFKRLMSGDRATARQAVAPEAATATAGADASKRQLATSGTARGGGVAGANQSLDERTRAQIDNMLFGARTGAASEVGKLGGETASIGLNQTGQAIQAEGLANKSAENIADLSRLSRTDSDRIHRQAVDDISGSIEGALSGAAPGLEKLAGMLFA